MYKKGIRLAAIIGLTAIILGAFGAHALKKVLTADQLISFETGVRYQMYHALFLLSVAVIPFLSDKSKSTISWFAGLGVLLFSGSIYVLALQNVLGFNAWFLGPVTPVGGILLIISWALLFLYSLKQKTNN